MPLRVASSTRHLVESDCTPVGPTISAPPVEQAEVRPDRIGSTRSVTPLLREELAQVVDEAPEALYARIRASVVLAPIGEGTEAQVFALAGTKRLLLRVAKHVTDARGSRCDLQSIVCRAHARFRPRNPTFRCIRIDYASRYATLADHPRLGLPQYAIVEKKHAFARSGRPVGPDNALHELSLVPMWILNRCEGESVSKVFVSDMPAIRSQVSVDGRTEPMPGARQTEIRRRALDGELKQSDFLREEAMLTRQIGDRNGWTAKIDSRIKEELRKARASTDVATWETALHRVRYVLDKCRSGDLRIQYGPQSFLVPQEAQTTFFETYLLQIERYFVAMRRLADVPQASYDEAALLCKRIRNADESLGVDFTHPNNVLFDPQSERFAMVDLAFDGRYPKPAIELLFWALIGGGKRLESPRVVSAVAQPWERLVYDRQREDFKPLAVSVLVKSLNAGEKHGLPFLEHAKDRKLYDVFDRYFGISDVARKERTKLAA